MAAHHVGWQGELSIWPQGLQERDLMTLCSVLAIARGPEGRPDAV
ncbi:Hypothetical protein RAK1035_0315 [Roseovarius sp. AK1035]|nr:Hypothetical protein RAK1035_0315 [Roseovarius sp. AK1035]